MTIAATRMYRSLDDFFSPDAYDNYVFLSFLDSLPEISIVARTYPIMVVAES